MKNRIQSALRCRLNYLLQKKKEKRKRKQLEKGDDNRFLSDRANLRIVKSSIPNVYGKVGNYLFARTVRATSSLAVVIGT